MHTLIPQFKDALKTINIGDSRREAAISAHTEIREHLEGDEQLIAWGIDTLLIGSYARHTAIYPGKDVDVLCRLTNLTGSADPTEVFEHVRDLLIAKYDSKASEQRRSVTVNFDRDGFEFSVDAVPAVKLGTRWGIPKRDTSLWSDPDPDVKWVKTDPPKLKTLTEERNGDLFVGGQGAYVPTVKAVRQIRKHHRGAAKPGGFYFELLTYWAFKDKKVSGSTFAEVLCTTLEAIAERLADDTPLKDPALGTDYAPAPDSFDLLNARLKFDGLARDARAALDEDSLCRAAAKWRQILGENPNGWCFPVPDGCDAFGNTLSAVSLGASRGSREPGSFA